MDRLEAAILKTIIYADIFEFPLTLTEIHHYLIHDEACSIVEIQKLLKESPHLQTIIGTQDGYYFLLNNQAHIARRLEREAIATHLWHKAYRYGHWLAHIPYVKMVAVTGALSANNPASENDDIDYMIVAQTGRVWFARACAVALVRIVRLLGTELCPNYVVSEDHLQQSRQDLFIAREIAQMVPIYGKATYEAFWSDNHWLSHFLANARTKPLPLEPNTPSKRLWERFFAGSLGDWIDAWEFRRKSPRFQTQIELEKSSAIIDSDHIKGHFDDHGSPILNQYHRKLDDYNHGKQSLLAGD